MGQFKPMVKMETTEPSVILKLKKGGKVKGAMVVGHKPMQNKAMFASMAAESGASPKRPSMMARRRAMNPNLYKKGGKVAHKLDGGGMPMGMPAAPMAAPMAPPMAARPAMGVRPPMRPQMDPRMLAMLKRKLMGMKKGGATDAECAKVEKELKRHKAMSSAKAHPMRKATGGVVMGKPAGYKLGGTIQGNEAAYKNTKMVGVKSDSAKGTGGVRMGNAGGFAKGGTINTSGWENRPANTAKAGASNTTTSGVKLGNGGGYARGGLAKYADGGAAEPQKKNRSIDQIAREIGTAWPKMNFAAKPYHDAMRSLSSVKDNYGADSGSSVVNYFLANAGTWKGEDAKRIKSELKEHLAKRYADGGSASKKAFATGGNVIDDGKAVKMPRHPVSSPVANTMQSGTFKSGGKVGMAGGGRMPLKGHPYHEKSEAELNYIRKDAAEAAQAMKNHNPTAESKYLDQINDAETVLGYRKGKFPSVYNEEAVNKSIASSNRSGSKIGSGEGKNIHRLLKGRYQEGGSLPPNSDRDIQKEREDKGAKDWEKNQREENERDKKAVDPMRFIQPAIDKVKKFIQPAPVAPAEKKRIGGKAC